MRSFRTTSFKIGTSASSSSTASTSDAWFACEITYAPSEPGGSSAASAAASSVSTYRESDSCAMDRAPAPDRVGVRERRGGRCAADGWNRVASTRPSRPDRPSERGGGQERREREARRRRRLLALRSRYQKGIFSRVVVAAPPTARRPRVVVVEGGSLTSSGSTPSSSAAPGTERRSSTPRRSSGRPELSSAESHATLSSSSRAR